MSEREIVRVSLLSLHIRDYGSDWPETLDGLISKLHRARELVPAEHRGVIKVDADFDHYEGGPGWVDIFYDRLETDEEITTRKENEAQYARENEARERLELSRLRDKYN